jgi:hypothetical protein
VAAAKTSTPCGGTTTTSAAPRAAQTITVTTYNTVTLSDNNIYTLVTPYAGPYYLDIFNLGPCTVYFRADADPAVNDPNSEMLPPYAADNLVFVCEGTVGLRFLAGPPCVAGNALGPPPCASGAVGCVATITVRLVRG